MSEFLGRYELLEEIGHGGFAIVYRARDTELDRLVALKELRSLLLTDTTWVKRFRREAKAVARLDHPHIVTVYDVGQVGDRHFLVMRLVNGTGLDEVIASRERLTWAEALDIVAAVAEGLDYAHARGILHRDLKPANILVDVDRGPMLSDFGFAKLVGDSSHSVTVTGDVVGTPHYIAPEAWEGKEVTKQADIYALGCILYEMLTGDKIFRGDTPPAVMMAHFRPLELPPRWPPGVPPGVVEVFQRALAKTPGERYATGDEMARALALLPDADTDEGPSQPVQVAAENHEPSSGDDGAPRPVHSGLEHETGNGQSVDQAAAWQQKAEQALAEGNTEGARSAAYQWQELAPGSLDLATFRRRLEAQVQVTETTPGPEEVVPAAGAATSAHPQVVIVKEDKRRSGCLWVSALVGLGLVLLVVVGLGGLCSNLERIINNVLPTVEVGERVEENIRIPQPVSAGPVNLDIEFGSGNLTIRPGAEAMLVDGTARYNVAQLKPEFTTEGDAVRLKHENSLGLASFTTSNLENEWNLKLGAAPLDLAISAGAARGEIELGGLSLVNLQVDQGAAHFELSFSESNRTEMELLKFNSGPSMVKLSGLANARAKEMIFDGGFGDFTLDFGGDLQRDVDVTVNGGVSTVTLSVPEGVKARVSVDSETTNVNVQGTWAENGTNVFTLPGQGNQISVEVNIGGGNLRLRDR